MTEKQTNSAGETPTASIGALDELQVALAMDGDQHAFALLYRRWHPRLLRHAMLLTGNPDDANDVMQEAAMAIARNIHRLQHPNKFGPWAYTIVRNKTANYIRYAQRDRKLKDLVRDDTTGGIDETPADERANTLRDLIEQLSERDREILTAYYVDGMSVKEIAVCVSVPVGTVKSRLHTARTRLKSNYVKKKENTDE